MWDESTYPFPNVSCCNIEGWDWMQLLIHSGIKVKLTMLKGPGELDITDTISQWTIATISQRSDNVRNCTLPNQYQICCIYIYIYIYIWACLLTMYIVTSVYIVTDHVLPFHYIVTDHNDCNIRKHIEAETRLVFCKRHIEIQLLIFLYEHCLVLIKVSVKFIPVVSKSRWQLFSDNGLVPNRPQAIDWTSLFCQFLRNTKIQSINAEQCI